MRNRLAVSIIALSVAGSVQAIQPADPQQAFWDELSTLCGKAFAGELTSYNMPMDQGWLGKNIVMHVRECSDEQISIPLHIDENRSRTWVLTRIDGAIRLKHDHRHEDGSEDAVTWYGGHTSDPGRGWRQSFPVDDYSKGLFLGNDLPGSITNIWNMELRSGQHFAYELVRVNRFLRVQFDLSEEVSLPPAPWGHE